MILSLFFTNLYKVELTDCQTSKDKTLLPTKCYQWKKFVYSLMIEGYGNHEILVFSISLKRASFIY